MKQTNIEGRSIEDAWFQLLKETLQNGYKYTIQHGSHNEGQQRLELDCATVHILHPNERPLVPIVPEGVPPPTSIEYVESDYLPYILSSNKKPNETYTYGEYFSPQFLKVIDMFNEHGYETNQACITIGSKDSIDWEDPPCLRLVDCRVRYGKLHWFLYFRSWDLWAGFPSNMAGLQMAKELMAEEIGVEDGEMFAFSKGVHLYEYSWEYAKAVTRI